MSLITLIEFKKFIHMTELDSDDLLQDILDGEFAAVEDQIKQTLTEATTTEYQDGDRTNTLILEHGLVSDVTSVKIDYDGDGEFEYELTLHDDYEWKKSGEIIYKNNYFSDGIKNVEVVYKHGYTALTLPKDLRIAILKIAANTFHATFVVVESEGDTKVFTQKSIDKVLGKYTRLVLA